MKSKVPGRWPSKKKKENDFFSTCTARRKPDTHYSDTWRQQVWYFAYILDIHEL